MIRSRFEKYIAVIDIAVNHTCRMKVLNILYKTFEMGFGDG
jgi:hypothetical protein